MPEAFDHSIVQFLNADGSRAVGTGFAISPRHVLTCTHVLASALGQDARQPIPLGTPFTASLPLNPCQQSIHLTLQVSHPRAEQPDIHTSEDISLLEITGTNALPHAPLATLPDSGHHGHSFRTYGFNRQGGSWFEGVCAGVVAEGWIQLQINNASDENLNGLSGAPVWDQQANAITGMLVAKLRGNLKSYMIPVSRLLRAIPDNICKASDAPPTIPASPAQQARKKLLETKLERLQAQYDLETRVEEQMRMEKLIAETQASLAQLEKG
jgi:hypothetical protein